MNDVEVIQRLLKKLGHDPGPIDGVRGARTNSAINAALGYYQQPEGNGFVLNDRSIRNTLGVHVDLVRVFEEAAKTSPHEFMITEGVRTLERQKQLKKKGLSKTLNSRHIPRNNRPGHAMDIALLKNGKIDWNDLKAYDEIGAHIKSVAKKLGVPIKWGGDWKWKDRPHYQLRWRDYPA